MIEPMIGLDTGFFVELLRGRPQPVRIWNQLTDGDLEAACSVLTLFELERLGLRGAIERHAADKLREAIPVICNLRWLDDLEVVSHAAAIGHGNGIPTVDALILASLLLEGAEVVYTTDEHLERFEKTGLEIVNLRKPRNESA